MNFLGDANRLSATGGKAALGGAQLEAGNFGNGPASVYLRPRDLDWSASGPGIAATVTRVIDRPDGRRILARTAAGEQIELDVTPETEARSGDQGSCASTAPASSPKPHRNSEKSRPPSTFLELAR